MQQNSNQKSVPTGGDNTGIIPFNITAGAYLVFVLAAAWLDSAVLNSPDDGWYVLFLSLPLYLVGLVWTLWNLTFILRTVFGHRRFSRKYALTLGADIVAAILAFFFASLQ